MREKVILPDRHSILITGTSSGFGLLAAVAFAQRGYHVYGTMRNLDKKEALLVACDKAGVPVVIRRLDVTKPETIAAVVDEMEKDCAGPDVLINNAGFAVSGFFEDTSNANFVEQFATNFYGVLNCTRAVLDGMRRRHNGLIINISSECGRCGLPCLSAYTASKFAVEGWSESLRMEVKKFGIYVVLVEPGEFKTDLASPTNLKIADNAQNPASPYFSIYSHLEANALRYMEKYGQNPMAVANIMLKIVATSRPRLRYIVGLDAKFERFLKAILPSSAFEWLMERLIARL